MNLCRVKHSMNRWKCQRNRTRLRFCFCMRKGGDV
nr:MAG TPA: hypothetical protein [Caudoviricetes sp.]